MVEGIQHGKITKIVHVRFAANGAGAETNLHGCDGYGILQGADGRDVFFVDSALQDAQFSELENGQEVLYVIEASPLRRAARVWATTAINPACLPLRELTAMQLPVRGSNGSSAPPEDI
jgi:cold shock CspA family protein